jgi:hypothetical protein
VSLLRAQLERLPDRELFLADRRTGLPGIWMRTADLQLEAQSQDIDEVEHSARRHPMLATIAELERAQDATARRVAELLDVGEANVPKEEQAPVRRARRGFDLG